MNDVEILEDWLNFRKLNFHIIEMEDSLKVVQALENILKERQEDKERIKELEKRLADVELQILENENY